MNEITNRYVASVAAPTMSADSISGHRYQGWTPCIIWCEKHIGDGWWFIGDGVFEFVDDADRTMFMLRWG
jgi:hypothetical protein